MARRCPYTKGTFRAVQWADGPMYVRCDACRRYVQLAMTPDLAERHVSRTTFSCTDCGAEGRLSDDDPAAKGYQLDPRDHPRRHAMAEARVRGLLGSSSYGRTTF